MRLLLLLLFCGEALAAGGRHWSIAVDSLDCRAALTIGLRVRYLGPPGAVEAPLAQLDGGRVLPASVVGGDLTAVPAKARGDGHGV